MPISKYISLAISLDSLVDLGGKFIATAIVVAQAAVETERPESPEKNQNSPPIKVIKQTHSTGFFSKKKTRL